MRSRPDWRATAPRTETRNRAKTKPTGGLVGGVSYVRVVGVRLGLVGLHLVGVGSFVRRGGCGCQNRFGLPFWLEGEVTHFGRSILVVGLGYDLDFEPSGVSVFAQATVNSNPLSHFGSSQVKSKPQTRI